MDVGALIFFQFVQELFKLRDLGLPHTRSTASSGHRQKVRVGHHTFSALSLSTGSPQGCVLGPLLYSFYTHTRLLPCPSEQHRCEVCRQDYRGRAGAVGVWPTTSCIDYRGKKTQTPALIISKDCVERVVDFRFLGVSIQESLSWSVNTSELLKKAKQRLYFLRILIIRITSHRDCW